MLKKKTNPKLKIFRRNAVLTVLSNFMLAMAIGLVGTALAQFLTMPQEKRLPSVLAILGGLVFLLFSTIIIHGKEVESD